MQLLGLLEFPFDLCCAKDVMGKNLAVTMAGFAGTLETPSLVDWIEGQKASAPNQRLGAPGIEEPLGEKLADKFRMLSGKLELIRTLNIPHPNKDYKALILEPQIV